MVSGQNSFGRWGGVFDDRRHRVTETWRVTQRRRTRARALLGFVVGPGLLDPCLGTWLTQRTGTMWLLWTTSVIFIRVLYLLISSHHDKWALRKNTSLYVHFRSSSIWRTSRGFHAHASPTTLVIGDEEPRTQMQHSKDMLNTDNKRIWAFPQSKTRSRNFSTASSCDFDSNREVQM